MTSVTDDGGPRLVSAVSTDNTSVVVTFSEEVGEGANKASNYSIVQANVNPESGTLIVHKATVSPDKLTVLLRTASQNEVAYELHVTGIKDLAGNPLASPTLLVDPTTTRFAGTPPTLAGGGGGSGGSNDSDGDGLPDNEEQYGWLVTVTLANGNRISRTVTSSISHKDTDGDGLTDAEEKAIGSDPRSVDTDGDQMPDGEEWNEWFSDPTDQDTDNDGLADALDIYFQTSPVIADTDGDQMSDAVEIIERNRNPLVADLPLPQIIVDGVRLDLKITSSYTDEQGVTRSVADSTSTTFSQSRSNTLGTSDTTSTESENEFSQKIGAEVSYSVKDGWGGKVTAEAGFGQRRTAGFSSTVNRESSQASQQEYQRSAQKALIDSERRAVTRNIDEAIIQANVSIANKSDIAFTITNLEISVQQQDRRNSRRFRPIATLRPAGATDPLSQPSYNLGPFDPERGPIIFQNVEVFPNLVDDLMREPTGLVFQVVNFDILDEFGRNFVFSSQEVNDRTAGITIDFGDGSVERYRVATNSKFDENGIALGISMERALAIAGITRVLGDDQPIVPPANPQDPLPPSIHKTYGTLANNDGTEILTRVRGVQNDLVAVPEAEKRFWAIITSNTDLPPNASFSSIVLQAGDDFLLTYTRDVDKDGLFEREEYLYGSDDRKVDTDEDTLSDFFEVRTGWTVKKLPGLPYKTFPDPSREDSDGDSLHDNAEMVLGTDPNRNDTDEDALLDAEEVSGHIEIQLFDGDADDTNDKLLVISPYSSWAIIDGGNGTADTTAAGDDVQVVAAGDPVAAGDIIIEPGPNGKLDTSPAEDDKASLAEEIVNGPGNTAESTAAGDDIQVVPVSNAAAPNQVLIRAGLNGVIDSVASGDDYKRVAHDGLFTTNPLNQDTDFDGLPDGREILIGTNPNSKDAGRVTDSDRDGLFDDEEDTGWEITVYDGSGTPTTFHVTSNKFRADTDLDGLPDVFERAIGSNPRLADADGDALFDVDEFDPENTDNYYDAAALQLANLRCGQAEACQAPPTPDLANRLRTDVRKIDTDGDGRDDDDEIYTPWTVSVFGQAPAAVYSKAWSADFDLDGLNDSQELAYGTDPNNADTDGDGLPSLAGSDAYEISVGRNPLRKDQRITFSYNAVVVNNICGDPGDSAEWHGRLYLTYPLTGGGSTTAELYKCTNCCQVNGSGECGISPSQSFVLYEGQSFTAHSNTWWECDSLAGSDRCD
ncbi:MAG: Ig-like domain-containing protein, partial [Planctomycetes bacterium]|nr:Ig-like domain-containing protein [Planctomycetota bacterium]